MASSTTLSLLALSQTFRSDIVDQINRSVQLLKLIPIVQGEGKNVAWPVEEDGENVENYSEGDDASTFGSTTQAQATLNWGLYRATPKVTQLAMDAGGSSYQPDGNHQLWGHAIAKHAAGLAKKINEECFNGPGTGTRIAGLDVAIGDDTNTYATIVRGTSAYWQPTVIDPGTDYAPGFADLRDDMRLVYEACGENPDMAFCAPEIFNYVGGLYDNTRRQVQSVDTLRTARGMVTLDQGFQALELDGMMFIKERAATSAQIYYVNSNHVALEVLPSHEEKLLFTRGALVQADDGYGSVPLSFKFEMLAKTGAAEKGQILSTCQLKVTRPNACAVRKHVATS